MPVITLPRSAIKELTQDTVVIDIPSDIVKKSYLDRPAFIAARGLLKNKKEQWLSYLDDVRSEWNGQN